LCDKEFNNAEELKQHKEEVHPMDQREVPDDMDKKNPEVKGEIPEAEPAVVPDPVHR